MLNQQISDLKSLKELLANEVIDIKIDNGTAKYVITLEIRQRHYFDLGKAMKDSMNVIEMKIPVDKEYFDSIEVGDILDDSFRMGSFLIEGSVGSWEIKVIDKKII